MAASNPTDELPIWDYTRPPTVTIECGGELLKPFLRPLNVLLDEAKIHFKHDGIHATAVDPANVAMVNIFLNGDALPTYDVDTPTTVGAPLSRLVGATRAARVNHEDTLELSVSRDEVRAKVHRDSAGVNIRINDAIRTIDPDSIREEPDVPTLLDHDNLDYGSTTLPLAAVQDTVGHVLDNYDQVTLRTDDGDMIVEPPSVEDDSSAAAIEGHGPDVDGKSIYSGDYLSDMLTGLKRARVDGVVVSYGDEVPLVLDATRTVGGGVAQTIRFTMAPRIKA